MKCTHPLCNKEFKTRKALNTHIRQAHPTWYKSGGKREDIRKSKKGLFQFRDYIMHSKGHFGLTLLVLSIFSIPIGLGPDNIMIVVILLSAGLSSIPDIDLKLGIKHRGLTHNILFAIITGILFGILFGYSSGLIFLLIGFTSGFLAVMLHLLGDLMTYQAFKPLWPFDQRELSYGLFAAKSENANKGFLTLGIVAFIGYIIVSSGSL